MADASNLSFPACLLISALISAAQRLLNPAMTPHAIVSAPSRNQFRQNKEARKELGADFQAQQLTCEATWI
jgi:hypothetical protein